MLIGHFWLGPDLNHSLEVHWFVLPFAVPGPCTRGPLCVSTRSWFLCHMGCLLFAGLSWTAMQLLRKLASPTYAIAEVNIWFPVLPSTPGHRLGVFGALGRRLWLVFLLVMVNFPIGFQAYKCVCHLGLYLQSLHRNLEKLLRTQCLSALFLIQIMHKYCGIVTSSCYVNTSSNLTGLQRIQMQSCHNQTTVTWQAWVLLCHSFSVSFPIIFSSQDVVVSLTTSCFLSAFISEHRA